MNATQSAIALLYLTAITGRIDASAQALMPKNISKRIVQQKGNGRQSSHRAKQERITLIYSSQKHYSTMLKKKDKESHYPQELIIFQEDNIVNITPVNNIDRAGKYIKTYTRKIKIKRREALYKSKKLY